jgi:hypothetical protein
MLAVQTVAPLADQEFRGQLLHAENPVFPAYVPARQAVQTELLTARAVPEKVPIGHWMQTELTDAPTEPE